MTTPDYNAATAVLDEIARVDAFKALYDPLIASNVPVKVSITFDDGAGSTISYDSKTNGIVSTHIAAMMADLTVWKATQISIFGGL